MRETNQRPFSIRIFVPNGDPDGLCVVEKSNWTGAGVVFRRTNYKQVISRSECRNTGVYVLVGTSAESSLPTVYIGEGDPVKDRRDSHYSKKEFWDWAVFFVTKDESLNKAHVKHLESQLLEQAKAAKLCKLDNTKTSLPPSLSEAETADVESFLLDMLSIFPLLGLSIFETVETGRMPENLLFINAKGIRASGYEDAKGFVVRKGSRMVKEELPTIHNYMATLRKDLLEQGTVEDDGQSFVFTQDRVFGSPSTASGVLLGRTDNGRVTWKTKDGTTLKSLQIASAKSVGKEERSAS